MYVGCAVAWCSKMGSQRDDLGLEQAGNVLAAASRDDMREAGRDYFNRMLTKTTDGSLSLKSSGKKRRAKLDADVMAVGAVIEGSKLYVLLGTCVSFRALGILLLKV
jgi:hypothetical protein